MKRFIQCFSDKITECSAVWPPSVEIQAGATNFVVVRAELGGCGLIHYPWLGPGVK